MWLYIGVLSPAENALYLPYANGIGPYDGTAGYVMKYFIGNGSWVDITPAQGIADNRSVLPNIASLEYR